MSFWKRACCRRRSAVGRFLGFFVRAVLMKLLKVGLYLSLSFNEGGLKPLLDIRKSARIGWRSNMGGCNSASSERVKSHELGVVVGEEVPTHLSP